MTTTHQYTLVDIDLPTEPEAIGPPALVWVDTETTGLNPREDYLLELAVVVTDAELRTLRRKSYLVNAPIEPVLRRLTQPENEGALLMHARNGLLDDLTDGFRRKVNLPDIDTDLLAMLGGSKAEHLPLAGASVHFDRAVLANNLPGFLNRLHYRNVDVSTVRELAKLWQPEARESEPERERVTHRAMDDIKSTIELARHYREAMGWKVTR